MIASMSVFSQESYEARFEWGLCGVEELSPQSDVLVIVDILNFTSAVNIAVSRGAVILPYWFKDGRAAEFAKSEGAVLAKDRHTREGFTLSSPTLLNIPAGTRLVLPSPNGATLSKHSKSRMTIAGSLRNATAVGTAVLEKKVAVIAAGERWHGDNSLRPALEDLIGAGAILHAISGTKSPEAKFAENAFLAVKDSLQDVLLNCTSGRELVEEGFPEDITVASEYDCSGTVPILDGNAYTDLSGL